MDEVIVMDVIFGTSLTQQFVKQNGKPEQHQRSGVFRLFQLEPDNGGSNPLGDANQFEELPVSGSSFSFDGDKIVIIFLAPFSEI
jgi:hypothetical protein